MVVLYYLRGHFVEVVILVKIEVVVLNTTGACTMHHAVMIVLVDLLGTDCKNCLVISTIGDVTQW